MPAWVTAVFWAVGLGASTLYGWNAVEIFTNIPKDERKKLPKSWAWHQRWLNFVGSLVGWIALWVLVRRYSRCLFEDCVTEPQGWDVLVAFIAFVGVTGYLPYTVVGIVSGATALASKAAELLKLIFPKPPSQ